MEILGILVLAAAVIGFFYVRSKRNSGSGTGRGGRGGSGSNHH